MFKIRNKKTGQFSNGGAHPKWTDNGKMWGQLHHVRSHLRNYRWNNRYTRADYRDAEIVEYQLVEVATHGVNDV